MIKLCDQAILYKGLSADMVPDSVIAEWSSVLSITKGETKQVGLFAVNVKICCNIYALLLNSCNMESKLKVTRSKSYLMSELLQYTLVVVRIAC